MHIEYHKWWSDHLGQEMELKVYGHAGKPVLVFPQQSGRFYDYENFGMIGAAEGFIEAGQYRFITVDSIDAQSWANYGAHPANRARRHEDYDRYIMNEVVPFAHGLAGPEALLFTTGCSMGGYHSANFFFRHPDVFDGVISISGLFQLSMFIGGYVDETVYFNSPLLYLGNLEDPQRLELYRRSQIVICAGQGAWEEEMNADIARLRWILETKGIPAWIDLWGYDVNHDWPWWRKMLPYFLGELMGESNS